MSPQARSVVDQGRSTRKAIIAAAVELFGTHGYRGCSLSQIAAKAGIGQSGVLHHFGSKEQLLLEVLNEYFPAERDRPDVAAIARGDVSFPDRLDEVAAHHADDDALVRFFSVLTGESLTEDHPARAFFIERYDAIRAEYSEAIAGRDAGPRIKLLVTVAFATMDGLQAQWLRNPAEVDLASGMRLITDFLRAELAR